MLFHQLLAWLWTHEVLFEVLGGTLTSSIDGGLFYPLRQSNRYPCNQICYARGTFQSQTLYKPNLYKWASFVHRIQYSCSIYCCTVNDAEAQLHRGGSEWARARTHTQKQTRIKTMFLCCCCFFFVSHVPLFFIAHTHTQPGLILSNLCWSNLWVIAEIASVGEVNRWLCREAVFSIKEKADARVGLRLLTDRCKDEQWDYPAS